MKAKALNYQRRLIAAYCAATENEIAVDNLIFSLFSLLPQTVGHLPRPSKWIHFADKYASLFYVFSFVAKQVWLYGGCILFFLYQFFPIWLRVKAIAIVSIHDDKDARYVLALTSRVGDILHSSHIENLPIKWVTMPWAPLRKTPSDIIEVKLFSLLSRKDVMNSLLLSIKSVYIMRGRKRTASWLLQSYTAFRWFVVRLALDKLPGEFVMIEHYDRWAVLADSSIHSSMSKKTSTTEKLIKNLTLIQHGAINDIAQGSNTLKPHGLKLRWKLRCVKKLIVYDPQSKDLFIKNILSQGCSDRGLDVFYYNPKIELSGNVLSNSFTVLFVGHTLCESLQQKIMSRLENNNIIKAYYKPHPISPMSSAMNISKWEIILDTSYFPAIDLLISYPSTLVTEYAGHNIPAIIHPINLSSSESLSFVASVAEQVDTMIQKKFPANYSIKLT